MRYKLDKRMKFAASWTFVSESVVHSFAHLHQFCAKIIIGIASVQTLNIFLIAVLEKFVLNI